MAAPPDAASPEATPPDDESWFHPDCWAEVLSAKQQEYRQRIERLGIAALIAPYVTPEAATR